MRPRAQNRSESGPAPRAAGPAGRERQAPGLWSRLPREPGICVCTTCTHTQTPSPGPHTPHGMQRRALRCVTAQPEASSASKWLRPLPGWLLPSWPGWGPRRALPLALTSRYSPSSLTVLPHLPSTPAPLPSGCCPVLAQGQGAGLQPPGPAVSYDPAPRPTRPAPASASLGPDPAHPGPSSRSFCSLCVRPGRGAPSPHLPSPVPDLVPPPDPDPWPFRPHVH